MPDREVLIEFRRIGNLVKVTATDPVTLTEVTIQGPAYSSQETLRRAVVAKLNYVLSRKSS